MDEGEKMTVDAPPPTSSLHVNAMNEGENMTCDAVPLPEREVPAGEGQLIQDKILKVLSTILEHYMVRFDEVKRELAVKMLTRIQPWIAEMREGPYQIADAQIHKTFFADVDQKCHQIMETINMHRASEKMTEDAAKTRNQENYRTHRPSYTKELMAQPWQQFLHPEAPGWPDKIPDHPRKVSHQIVPNGGMRLLLKWEEEVKEIYGFLDANRAGPSRFQSGLRSLSVNPVLGMTKNGDVRTVALRRMQTPPFTKLHRDLTEMDDGDFSLANRVLGKLEGHRIQDNNFLVADVMELKRGQGSGSGSTQKGSDNDEVDQNDN